MDYCYNPDTDLEFLVAIWLQFLFKGGCMGYSRAEKEKTHKRIVSIASKRFRENGLAGVGIADLMREAGLTVGGFYKHFKSRDALVAEAVGAALGTWERQVDAAASGGPPVTYASLIDEYLSETHRKRLGTGCPVAALTADISRSDKGTRALVTRNIRDNIQLLEGLIRDTDPKNKSSARSQAVLLTVHWSARLAWPARCRISGSRARS